jgi:serine kinase of HPr protein (carbohydrate metabolism regulator)
MKGARAGNDDRGRSGCTVHGNALIVGEAGVLLRGPSGSGKSSLALDLIAFAAQRGVFARLIADDRVEVVNSHGRLIARPHSAIAGAIEERGVGIVPTPHEPAGVIRCVADLSAPTTPPPERLPPEEALEVDLCGVRLPRIVVEASRPGTSRKIFSFIHYLVAN